LDAFGTTNISSYELIFCLGVAGGQKSKAPVESEPDSEEDYSDSEDEGKDGYKRGKPFSPVCLLERLVTKVRKLANMLHSTTESLHLLGACRRQ